MQIEKHKEFILIVYFLILMLLVISDMCTKIDFINVAYLAVVFVCSLRCLFIMNLHK